MKEITKKVRFSLSSYWRIGSGRGSDAVADELVLRDPNGLPVIPGRTIKGLLRDALGIAGQSGVVSQEEISRWFGTPIAGGFDGVGDKQEAALEEGRFLSEEGSLWFGSAQLSSDWQNWARQAKLQEDPRSKDQAILSELFRLQSSTAIDELGVAQENSLRVAEVAVPMDLVAEIRGPASDKGWAEALGQAFPVLRALGSRRSRGYGRVDVSWEDN